MHCLFTRGLVLIDLEFTSDDYEFLSDLYASNTGVCLFFVLLFKDVFVEIFVEIR